MADKAGSVANLLKDGKSRAIILVMFFILFLAVIMGILVVRSNVKGAPSSAALPGGQTNLQSIPFNAPNDEYARLQEKQNKQIAEKANQTGTSAIPTIVHAEKGGQDLEPPPSVVSDTGLGFTGLKREQSDAGVFAPKEFGVQQNNCPVVEPGLPNTVSMGTPVYDKAGRLIGYAGAGGVVRNIDGKVIGTLGPDGVVRDSAGNVIGEINTPLAGTPVYDASGNVIGHVGADGLVRDAAGHVIGTLGPDGVLRNAAGKILGHTGTPVYAPDGKLLGYAGPDGKIRNASGQIVGTVDPDGVARNLQGDIIGKAGSISPGTPIYGPDGKIIGYVSPGGKVRDANGNVIGTIGADGLVRNTSGAVIGSTSMPSVAPKKIEPVVASDSADLPGTQNKNTDNNALAVQQAIMKDQALQQMVQQKQQSMVSQANQLLTAWSPPSQQWVAGAENKNSADNQPGQGSYAAAASKSASAMSTVFIKAGTVYYGVINTAINSDEPGPVMATIINGPYKGGRLLGTLTNQGQAVMLLFNMLSLPNFPRSLPVNIVAIDQNTARTGLSTETNNHYLLRYGAVFASAFIQGYGQAFQTSGSTVTTNGLSTQASTPDLSPQGKFFVALGNVGQQFSNQAQIAFNQAPTVHVASGTAVGLLFLADAQISN